MLVEIGNQNVSSLSGVGDGNGPTDAAIATGDNGLLAVEAAAALVGRFAMVGSWIHGGCLAGHRLVLDRKRRAGIIQHGLGLRSLNHNCIQPQLAKFVPHGNGSGRICTAEPVPRAGYEERSRGSPIDSGGFTFWKGHKMQYLAPCLALILLGTPAMAQSVGEKTGVNSTLGIAPKTEDFVKQA